MNLGGWRCDTGGDRASQVYPVDDLREHVTDGGPCWCSPKIEDGMVIHNSLDRREVAEQEGRLN